MKPLPVGSTHITNTGGLRPLIKEQISGILLLQHCVRKAGWISFFSDIYFYIRLKYQHETVELQLK